MRLRLLSLAVFFVLTLGMDACKGGGASPPQVLEIQITAQDIRWEVGKLEVQVGQPVRFVITNEGLLDHNFELQELGIDENIAAGETIEINAVFEKVGEFVFRCNVPGHAEAGMVGTVTVHD